jgi:Raf kinase inhibitor-like YbhB/YbcL family protein
MKLTSAAFSDQSPIPSKYTCEGDNTSPPLSMTDVPGGTASIVLFMEDPDAPVGIFDHWIMFDIDPTIGEISEGTEPQGIHGKGSSGKLAYVGPCPPSGIHRYLFTVYALDIKLSLPQGSTKLEVVSSMNGHVLEQAQLVGTYQKKK